MITYPGSIAQDLLLDAFYEGRYTEVIEQSQQQITGGDSTSRPFVMKAMAQIQLGKPREAIATLKEGRDRFPEEPRMRNMLAGLFLETGDFSSADSLYRVMVNGDTGDLSSMIRLAEIAQFRQQHPEALSWLDRVLARDSTHLKSLMMKGEILTRLNDTTALEWYGKAFMHYPRNQQAAYALGNGYIQAGQPLRAVPVADRILEADSAHIRFLKLKGFALYRSGKPREALGQFEKAAGLGDSTAFTFKYLGISRYLIMDFPGAIPPLELALDLDSLDADIHFFLGASLATTTRKPEAMAHLDKALELMNPDPAAVARIYEEQGNLLRLEMEYLQAYERYRMSWEADTTRPMPLYYMASIMDNSLHRSREALADYQRFIDQLDRMQPEEREESQIPSIREIVEDRIIRLREELFLLDGE